MGCILSEVVTWVTEGRKKLQEYRRRRLEEVGKTFSNREDRFHCNGEVLDTVNQLHDELMQNNRRLDYVTPMIVEGLVHTSIIVNYQSRASAHHLSYQSSRILKEAEKKLERERSHTVSNGVPKAKKRLPPNLPLRSASTSSAGTLEVEAANYDQGQTSRHPKRFNDLQERAIHSGWVRNGTAKEPGNPSNSHNGNRNRTIPTEQSQARYEQPNSVFRRPERVLSQADFSSMQRQQHPRFSTNTAQMEILNQQHHRSIVEQGHDTPQASYFPLRSRQYRYSATSAGRPATRPSTTEGVPYLPDFKDSDPFVESGVASPHSLEACDRDEEYSSPYRPPRKDRPHPHMSVDEGLKIKEARERGQNAKYPDQDILKTSDAVLRKRDHVSRSISPPFHFPDHSGLEVADSRRRFLSTMLKA